MSNYPGAYFGIVPITSNVSNLTCLAQNKVIEQWGTCANFFSHLAKTNPLLAEINFSSIEWLEGKAPEFKAQTLPNWNNAFWIGDALASFYPAIGYGFGHSVNSALSATQFYLHADSTAYTQFIQKEIKYKLWLGTFLHRALMNQPLSRILLSLAQTSPRLSQFFIRKVV
jgi:flavin-dependent dehydrogenase